MGITYDETGLHIKKLFTSREIPYSDIKSVVLADSEYTFTTNDGEVIKFKSRLFDNHEILWDASRKYNIHFKDEDSLKDADDVYIIEEVNEKIAQTQAVVEEYAGNLIRDKFGPEYGIDTKVIDEGEWINMYLMLLKNGELVKDIPRKAKYEDADIEPDSFDNFVLAFLLEWDDCGRYGVTREVENRESCEKYLTLSLNHFFEHYKVHIG